MCAKNILSVMTFDTLIVVRNIYLLSEMIDLNELSDRGFFGRLLDAKGIMFRLFNLLLAESKAICKCMGQICFWSQYRYNLKFNILKL